MPQEGPSKGDFFAVGIYGQYVYVNPAAGIVIAKNAADREFTFEQSNGQHSMNMNIDMFRRLAEQLKTVVGVPYGMQPLTSLDFRKNPELAGCGCSFYKDGALIFDGTGEKGCFKANNELVILNGVQADVGALEFLVPYEGLGFTIELERDEGLGVDIGIENNEQSGRMLINKQGEDVILEGKVRCGC